MDPQFRNSVLTFLLLSADSANKKNSNVARATKSTSLNLNTQLASAFFSNDILSAHAIPNLGSKVLYINEYYILRLAFRNITLDNNVKIYI